MTGSEGYPHAPGYKLGDTDKAAAQAMRAPAKTLEAMCLVALQEGPQTPEELRDWIEAATGRRTLLTSVRPRLSQLKARGKVRDSGKRGLGEGGRCKAIKWELAPPAGGTDGARPGP